MRHRHRRIDGGVYGPECPWEAIFEDADVPSVFEEDSALNAKMLECKDEFRVPEVEDKPHPTRLAWGGECGEVYAGLTPRPRSGRCGRVPQVQREHRAQVPSPVGGLG